jgi:small subunit ribosomal protein S14
MATKAWISKQKRREALVARFADIRRQLKKEKNFAALAKLPRDSSPTAVAQPLSAHWPLEGRTLRKFKVSRIMLRELRPGRQDPGHEEG